MTETARQEGARARRGADTRREILVVARRMFGERGFGRTSMSDIAAEVGVVEGALYKHFPGKRELLLEAARAHTGCWQKLLFPTPRVVKSTRFSARACAPYF